MKATFLGHQSWLISSGNTNILIDPVLQNNSPNENDDIAVEIYPSRSINIKNMPKIDAIILSHEHPDHFHMPTLHEFRSSSIICGPVMVGCVLDTLSNSDMKPTIFAFYKKYTIGDLEIILYPAGKNTAFWENRVTQILIRSKSNPNNSLFIAVDATVSEEFKQDIRNNVVPMPNAIFVSNNSQLPPKGVLGVLDNYKNPNTACNKNMGLLLLQIILNHDLEGLYDINDIVICGGGFSKKYETIFGLYPLSDQKKLAEIANHFSPNKMVYGPIPGEVLKIGDKVEYVEPVNWVTIDKKRINEIVEAGVKFQNNQTKIDIKPVINNIAKPKLEAFNKDLSKLAKAFMLSEIGAKATSILALKTTQEPPYCLSLKLYHDESFKKLTYYVLNINKCEFELVDVNNIEENLIPFGIELFLNDFIGILEGRVQIWDILGIGIKSWYEGDILDSPITFFYCYFGEHIQMELNSKALQSKYNISDQANIGDK